jgi:hypothetical protein
MLSEVLDGKRVRYDLGWDKPGPDDPTFEDYRRVFALGDFTNVNGVAIRMVSDTSNNKDVVAFRTELRRLHKALKQK